MRQRYLSRSVEFHSAHHPKIPGSLLLRHCPEPGPQPVSDQHREEAQLPFDAALDELEDTIPALGTVESELEAKELSNCISKYLARLPYDDRYAFLRRYYYADSITDIAETLGKTPHRISVRLFRIRDNLKKYLRKEGMLP